MVATKNPATAFMSEGRGTGSGRSACERCSVGSPARLSAPGPAIMFAVAVLFAAGPAAAANNRVRITNLSDVAFGTIANLGVDAIQKQNVCVYADTNTNGYNVTGIGTGPGGAFQLSSGANSMSFDVLWSSSAGQSTGAQLTPNVPLTGQVSGAAQQTCNSGPANTASLVLVLRSIALSSAVAGSYNGTLTLVIGPE